MGHGALGPRHHRVIEFDNTALDSVLAVWHTNAPTINEGDETLAEQRLLFAILTLAATVEELRRTIAESNPFFLEATPR